MGRSEILRGGKSKRAPTLWDSCGSNLSLLWDCLSCLVPEPCLSDRMRQRNWEMVLMKKNKTVGSSQRIWVPRTLDNQNTVGKCNGKIAVSPRADCIVDISCNWDIIGPHYAMSLNFSLRSLEKKTHIPFYWAHSVPNTRHQSTYHVLQDWVLCDYFSHTSFHWNRPRWNETRGAG